MLRASDAQTGHWPGRCLRFSLSRSPTTRELGDSCCTYAVNAIEIESPALCECNPTSGAAECSFQSRTATRDDSALAPDLTGVWAHERTTPAGRVLDLAASHAVLALTRLRRYDAKHVRSEHHDWNPIRRGPRMRPCAVVESSRPANAAYEGWQAELDGAGAASERPPRSVRTVAGRTHAGGRVHQPLRTGAYRPLEGWPTSIRSDVQVSFPRTPFGDVAARFEFSIHAEGGPVSRSGIQHPPTCSPDATSAP